MANTFTLIASYTLGSSGQTTIDFTSIPQTYTDLCLKFSARFNVSDADTLLKFNGSTTSYTTKRMYGNGSTYASDSPVREAGWSNPSDYTTNSFSNSEIYIPNYTSSIYKTYTGDAVTENNGTTSYQSYIAGLWSNNNPITSITLIEGSNTFVQYSTAYLYGIKNS